MTTVNAAQPRDQDHQEFSPPLAFLQLTTRKTAHHGELQGVEGGLLSKRVLEGLGLVLGDLGAGPRTCGFALGKILPGNGCNGVTWSFLQFGQCSCSCLFKHDYRVFLFLFWSITVRVGLAEVSVLWNHLCQTGDVQGPPERVRPAPRYQRLLFSLSTLFLLNMLGSIVLRAQ